jgi:hypothetical protein
MMGPSEERTRSAVLRIFSNLVHKAIEAMDSVDGRRILKVRTELIAGDSISVAVEDTGLGLSSEETNTYLRHSLRRSLREWDWD